MKLLLLILLTTQCGTDRAIREARLPDGNRYAIKVLTVHDADTFTADIDLGFGLTYKNQSCRLYNFDAWEVSRTRTSVTVTDAEIIRGKQARDVLRRMLAEAKTVMVVSRKPVREKYGRLLVSIECDGKDVATILRAQGFERK